MKKYKKIQNSYTFNGNFNMNYRNNINDKKENKFVDHSVKRYKGLIYDKYLLSILNYLRSQYIFESETIKNKTLLKIFNDKRNLKRDDSFILMKVKFSDFFFRESKKQVVMTKLITLNRKKERRLLFSKGKSRLHFYTDITALNEIFKYRRFFFFFDPKKINNYGANVFDRKYLLKLKSENLINNNSNKPNTLIYIDKLIQRKGILVDDHSTLTNIETSKYPNSLFKTVDTWSTMFVFIFCIVEFLLVSFIFIWYFGSFIDVLTFFSKNFLIFSPYYIISNQSNIFGFFLLFYFFFWMVTEVIYRLTDLDEMDEYERSLSFDFEADFDNTMYEVNRIPKISTILSGIYAFFYVFPLYFFFFFFCFKFFSFFFILFKIFFFPTVAFPFLMLLKFFYFLKDLFFFKYGSKSKFERVYWPQNYRVRKFLDRKYPADNTFYDQFIRRRKDDFSKKRELKFPFVLPAKELEDLKGKILESSSEFKSYTFPFIYDREKNSFFHQNVDETSKRKDFFRWLKGFHNGNEMFTETASNYRKFWKKSFFWLKKDFSYSNTDFLLRKVLHIENLKKNKDGFFIEDRNLKKNKHLIKRSNVFYWNFFNKNFLYDIKYPLKDIKKKQVFPRFKYFRLKNPLLKKLQLYRQFFHLSDDHVKGSLLRRKKENETLHYNVIRERNRWKRFQESSLSDSLDLVNKVRIKSLIEKGKFEQEMSDEEAEQYKEDLETELEKVEKGENMPPSNLINIPGLEDFDEKALIHDSKIVRRGFYDDEDDSIFIEGEFNENDLSKNLQTEDVLIGSKSGRHGEFNELNKMNVDNFFINENKFRENQLRKVGFAYRDLELFGKKMAENSNFLSRRYGLLRKISLYKRRPIDYKLGVVLKNKYITKGPKYKTIRRAFISYKKLPEYKLRTAGKLRKSRSKTKFENEKRFARKYFRYRRFFKWTPKWIFRKVKGGKKHKARKLEMGSLFYKANKKRWELRLLRSLYLPFFKTYNKTRFDFDKFKEYSWILKKYRKKSKRKRFLSKSILEKRIYDKNFVKKSFFFLRNEEILKRALNYNYFVKSNHPLKNYNFFCPDQDYLGKILSIYFFRSFRKNKIYNKNRSYFNMYQFKNQPERVGDFFNLKRFPERIIFFDEDKLYNTLIAEDYKVPTDLLKILNYGKFQNILDISSNNFRRHKFPLLRKVEIINLRLKMLFFDALSGERKSYHIINNKFLNFLQNRMQKSLVRRYNEFYQPVRFRGGRLFSYISRQYPYIRDLRLSRLGKSKRALKGYISRLNIRKPGINRRAYYGNLFRDKLFSLFFEKNDVKFKSALLKNKGGSNYRNTFKMLPGVKIRPFYDLFEKKTSDNLYFSNNFWNKYRHLLLLESILLEDLFAKKKYKNLNYNFYNKKTKYNISQFLNKWDFEDIDYLKNLKQKLSGSPFSFIRAKKIERSDRLKFSYLKNNYRGNSYTVKLYKNLLLYRKFRKITLQLEMLKYNILSKKLDESDPQFVKWKAQYIKMLFLRKLCILFLLRKKQSSIFFFNYFRLNDRNRKDKTLINNPFIILRKRAKKKTKSFYKDFVLWKKWKNFLSMKVKNKLLSRQKKYLDLFDENFIGGTYLRKSPRAFRFKPPHGKNSYYFIRSKKYKLSEGDLHFFKESDQEDEDFDIFKSYDTPLHSQYRNIFKENIFKNSGQFLSQDFLRYLPSMVDEDRHEFDKEFILYNKGLDEEYIGEDVFDFQQSFWLNPINNNKINNNYNAMSSEGVFSKLKKNKHFFLNSSFSRLRDREEEEQVYYPWKLRSNNYFPKFPVNSFSYSKRYLAFKGIGNFFFKKKKIKNFRSLKLDDGLNINLNFFLNTKKKIELNSKKSFFLRLGNFIKQGINLFFLRNLEIIDTESLKVLFDDKSDAFYTHSYLFDLLLRKYLVFLDLNNEFVYSKKINNFGKIKTFILYLRLRKMEKSLDPSLLKNDNFKYLQKIRLPFSRFIFWVLRNELRKKYLFRKMKKNRNVFFTNKLFNVYYPSLFVDHVHNRKRKFFFNKILKRNKSKIYSTLISKSFKLLFMPTSFKKKIYKKHRVLFGQKNLKKRINNGSFRRTTNILLDSFNVFNHYIGSFNKKSPVSRALFFSSNVLKDLDNLTVETQLKLDQQRKKFYAKNKDQEYFNFLLKSGLIEEKFLSNYLNLVSKNYIILKRNKLNFIFNGNGSLNSKKLIKDSFLENSFLLKSFNLNKTKLNNKLFNLLLSLNNLPHGIFDQYGFFPFTFSKIDYSNFRKLYLKRYLLHGEEKNNEFDKTRVFKYSNNSIFNLLLSLNDLPHGIFDQYGFFPFTFSKIDYSNFRKLYLKRYLLRDEEKNNEFNKTGAIKYIKGPENLLNLKKFVDINDFVGLKRRWLFMRHFLYKYTDLNFNIKKKDKLLFEYDFFFYRKYRKYNYILNNIFFSDNFANKRRLVTSNNDFFFDWWNMNLSFFSRYRDQQLFFIKKNLLDSSNIGVKLNNNNLSSENIRTVFFNVNNVLVNSNKNQHNVELYPRYVGRSLREKTNEFYNRKENIYSSSKLIRDPYLLYGKMPIYDKNKRVKKSNNNIGKSEYKFSEFLKRRYPLYRMLNRRYDIISGEQRKEQRNEILPNIFLGNSLNRFYDKRQGFRSSFKLNSHHKFVDPRNFAFYPFFVSRKFYKKYSFLFNNKKVDPNFFFNFLINIGFFNKYKYFEDRELFRNLHLKGDLVLPIKAKYNFKNSKNMISYWKQLKNLFKFDSKKNFLIWLKRKYGLNLTSSNQNNSFIWKDRYKFENSNLKSSVLNLNFQNENRRPGFLALKTQAVYSNGNIRIDLNRSKDDFFFKRQKLLKLMKNSVFSFKAIIGFLYFKYQIFGWNDRLNFHVRLDDSENFLDFELDKMIIDRTNELFLPSYWVYRIPFSNVFYNYFCNNNNFLDSSLTLTEKSEVVMRLNSFLNIFNSNSFNYSKFLYNNSETFTKIMNETFLLPKMMGYNAFYDVEIQLREKLNAVNSDVLGFNKINDLILAEQLKKLTYNELYKLILQYENLVLDRKQRRFLNLTQVVENDFISNFEKLFNIFYWEKKNNLMKPFFFTEDKFFLLNKTQYEVLSNFSFIEHLYNSSLIGNVSFPQKVWVFDKFLKWFNNNLDLFFVDLKLFEFFPSKFLDNQQKDYIDSFSYFLLKVFEKIYKSKLDLYFENIISFDWIYSNNFIPFLFYLFNVYFFFFFYIIVIFFYYFWYLNFIYKKPLSESAAFVDGSDWESRPLINQKTTTKFFESHTQLKSHFKKLILGPHYFIDNLDSDEEYMILKKSFNEKAGINDSLFSRLLTFRKFRLKDKFYPLEKYPLKGLNRFFIKNRRRFLKGGTSLFRKRFGNLRIKRYRQSYTHSLNAHFERTCMPRRFFSILRFSAKKGWHHYSRVNGIIKNHSKKLNFYRDEQGSFVRMKDIFNKFGGIHYNVNLKLLQNNLGLIKNKFNVKKKRDKFFEKSRSSLVLAEKLFFGIRKDNVFNFEIRNLDFFRHLSNSRYNFGFKKNFFIFFLRDVCKNNITNLNKDYFNFKQKEYNQNIYNRFSKLFKIRKFFLRRKDFWLKVKLNIDDLKLDQGKVLSDEEIKDNLGKEFREREAQKEAQKKKQKEENERRSSLSKEEREAEDRKIEEEKQKKILEEEKKKMIEEEERKSIEKHDKKNRFFKKKNLYEKAFVYKRTLKRPKSFVFFRNRLFENFAEDQLYNEGFEDDFYFLVPKIFSLRFLDILMKGTFFFFKFILMFFIFFFIFLCSYKFYLFIF